MSYPKPWDRIRVVPPVTKHKIGTGLFGGVHDCSPLPQINVESIGPSSCRIAFGSNIHSQGFTKASCKLMSEFFAELADQLDTPRC